jgi:hypothetical protein
MEPIQLSALHVSDLRQGMAEWFRFINTGANNVGMSRVLDATALVRTSLTDSRDYDLPTARNRHANDWVREAITTAPSDVAALSLRVAYARRTYPAYADYTTNYEPLVTQLFRDCLGEIGLAGDAVFNMHDLVRDEWSPIRALDRGLGYFTAIARNRRRAADVLGYVDRVRTDDTSTSSLHLDPGADAEPRDQASDLPSRLPDSVDRALPRETRAGPALAASDDDPAPAQHRGGRS